MREIKRVAIIGSGIMGGSIAAVVANCGLPCLMLDIVPPNLSNEDKNNKEKRNSFAAASKANLFKSRPSAIYTKSIPDLIEIGNFEDDFDKIADCDWICEVVKEDLVIKKAVFEKIAQFRSKGSIVSTNTSGIPIKSMVDIMDEDMRQHFIGTHFFNPPRYLKLLELIPGPDTLPEVVTLMAEFFENILGRGVVYAKDTPNFVANRIATFGTVYAAHEMIKDGLTVEEVDAVFGRISGHASSACWRTLDMVGLDTFVHVLRNVYDACPDDEQRDTYNPPEYVKKMVEKGYLGDKSGSGFFKKTDQRDETGRSIILSIDPATLEYKPQIKPVFDCIGAAKKAKTVEEKLRIVHTGEDKGSKFIWKVFATEAIYAVNRVPEITDDIINIDNALKWGYGREKGIFEIWDILGFDYVCDRMAAEGFKVPQLVLDMKAAGVKSFYEADGAKTTCFDFIKKKHQPISLNPHVIILKDLKRAGAVVKENDEASLIDLGDGIVCVEFHSKMNTVGADLMKMVKEGVDLVNDGKFDGMVVGNQGEHFCAGANLMLILANIMQKKFEPIRDMIVTFQNINMAMRFCRGPVVSAPHHYTFGGGIEMAQHATKAVIAGETYGGLVEVGVGLLPAGGGTKEMLRRALRFVPASLQEGNPFPYVRRAFEDIAMAKVSTSGPELIELGYFTGHDIICTNFDQQIKRAKDVCRGLVISGYRPPLPAKLTALGEPVRSAFRAALFNLQQGGYASEHDVLIAMHVANILTGGDRVPGSKMTEQDVLDLECEAFLSLCGTKKSQERMQQMLATGKPLRN